MSESKYYEHRAQWFLKEGDIITCQDDTFFTITGAPVGLGGSAIVYPACHSENGTQYAIKECFPNDPRFCRSEVTGAVAPVDAQDPDARALLELYRENLKKEKYIGQVIGNTATRTVGILDQLRLRSITVGGRVCSPGDAMFTLLMRMDRKAKSFNSLLAEFAELCPEEQKRYTRGLPPIHITARIMLQVLTALKQVHDARDQELPGMSGYYYGDLHNGNVYFTESDPASGEVGLAHLLDFGSTRALDSRGETEKLVDREVFSTNGFRPPEASVKGPFRLTKKADLYSAGCLMLMCVATPAKLLPHKDGKDIGAEFLDAGDAARIGCTENSRRLVNRILYQSMRENPGDRYGSVDRMLADVRQLAADTAPPSHRLPENLSTPDYFVPGSRSRELAVLSEALESNSTVFLWGMGGIGKTELAMKLARELRPSRGSYLIHYQGSMRKTILSLDFEGYASPQGGRNRAAKLAELEDLEARFGILQKEYAGALFVIDNFDHPDKTLNDLREEPELRRLSELGIRLIITTRAPARGLPGLEVRELREEDQLKLMRSACTDPAVSDDILRELIREVGGHTLTICLMSRTLGSDETSVSPMHMLDALRRCRLSQAGLPCVATDQNRTHSQAQIHQHLKAVFDLSAMGPAARAVMDLAAFLPREGMQLKLLEQCLTGEQLAARLQLVRTGWLRQSDGYMVSIHPLIREVVRDEMGPGHTGCGQFRRRLEELMDTGSLCVMHGGVPRWLNARLDEAQLRQVAGWACEAADFLEGVQWPWFAGWALARVGRFTRAKQYARIALDRAEEAPPADPRELAEHWHWAARVYYELDWPQCLTYVERECAQWEELLRGSGADRPALLRRYAEALILGCRVCYLDFYYSVSRKQCREEDALEYGRRALEAIGGCGTAEPLLISQVRLMRSVTYGRMALLGRDAPNGLLTGIGRHLRFRAMGDSLERMQLEELELARAAAEEVCGCPSWQALIREALGDIQEGSGRQSHYRAALALWRGQTAANPEAQSAIWDNIAQLHLKLGDRREAARWRMEGVRLRKNTWYRRFLVRLELFFDRSDRHPGERTLMARSLHDAGSIALVSVLIPLGLLTLAAMALVLCDELRLLISFLRQEHADRRR